MVPTPSSPPAAETEAEHAAKADVSLLLRVLDHRGDDPRQCAQVYAQLRRIASAHRSRYIGTPTMSTTGLVHEAYLKLARSSVRFRSRSHLMVTLSRAMRQVLLTYAEARCTQKRGGGVRPLPLDSVSGIGMTDSEAADVLSIGEALKRLETRDPRSARVVECRFFAGLTVAETAAALGVSPATVTRCWRSARSWLYRELSPERPIPHRGLAPAA